MCTIIAPTSLHDLEAIDMMLRANHAGYIYVIDLSHMSIVNSIFVATLIAHPKYVAIYNPSNKVRTTLDVLGVSKVVRIVNSPIDIYLEEPIENSSGQ